MMLLKQLKQFTLSSTLRNAVSGTNVLRLARSYGSPVLCQSLTTSKSPKKPSRDELLVAAEAFVTEYRAAHRGKFPSYTTTHKEVGGGYYTVRDIIQELKLKRNAPLPIVAKPLSEVSASSVPNDASSGVLNDADADSQSHSSASVANDAKHLSEISASVADDASSQALNDAVADTLSHISGCNGKHFSDVVLDPVLQGGSSDTIETGSDLRQATLEVPHPNSDESNLVTTATDDKKETEIASNNDIDIKRDIKTHLLESQKTIELEECLKISETKKEENVRHSGTQESKADSLEGAAVSENVPTEAAKMTRQDSERGLVEVKTGFDELRAAMEAFVTEYRVANGGKFPSIKATQKKVGGSYYIVRDLLQELKLKPNAPLPIIAKPLSEVSASSVPNDASSQALKDADIDPQSHSSACNAKHFSAVVVDPVPQAGSSDTIETGSDSRQVTLEVPHPNSDESNRQGNNLVNTATDVKKETEIASTYDFDSKRDSKTHLLESPKANAVPTEAVKITRQDPERGHVEVKTGEKSSAWSNIISSAKEFANYWRKG